LVQFWVDVLDIPSVGIADNFFWIGGDSITGAQLIDRVNATFQIDIPLASVFKYPTVESQAEVVTNELLGEVEGLSDAELKLLNE
jgi:acyl carrier protein